MKNLLLIFLFFSPLFAKEHIIDRQENFPITSTAYQITPKVNPITGDYVEEETDLVVAGIEPLSVRRFYCHTAPYEPRTGGWIFNPETYAAANFEWPDQPCFAAIGDHSGSIVCLEQQGHFSYTLDPSKQKSFIGLNGQTHPLNLSINYYRIGDNDKRFSWVGEIKDGSGSVRSFSSPMHAWKSKVRLTYSKNNFLHGKKEVLVITPNVWTPYFLRVDEERRPNGNILVYSYTKWRDDADYPQPYLLQRITAYNSDKSHVLGWLEFRYQIHKERVYGISAVGSDGRSMGIQTAGDKPIMLSAAHFPNKPSVSYHTQSSTLHQVTYPEGRYLLTRYTADNKVASQHGPYGPIASYVYHDGYTEVTDGENNKTLYHYDKDKRLTAIETPLRTDRFVWNASGDLVRKTIEWKGKLLQFTEYIYDSRHNPIQETIGDNTQSYTLYRTFNDRNLKTEEHDDFGKQTVYTYQPNTNLLLSETCGDKTITHFYKDAIRIKTITQDGTLYTITEITPTSNGLPETIQESTDEGLLKKVRYTYHPSGQVLKEEHYDSTNTLRYTIENTYDAKERLIQTKDPLGQITKFTYDANHNLTQVIGPKPKQITYDLMNRPIQVTEGALTTKKTYDHLSRVTSETDPSGFVTHYTYDALGRVTKITYPDGTTETKEYDALGNITKQIDANGYVTHTSYNFRGQPTAIHHPDGTQESFTYHPCGTLASHTDTQGITTRYTYDAYDHLIQKQSLAKTTLATYTPTLQLSATDPEAVTTTYTYDHAGRKIAEQTDTKQTLFFYDTLGRLYKTQEGDTLSITEYDLLDRPVEKRIEVGDQILFRENYTYDASGNQTGVITCSGISQTEYNTQDLPIHYLSPTQDLTQYSYDYTNGFVKTTLDPKGVITTETHDSRGRQTRLTTQHAGVTLQHTEKSYDNNGNLTKETHTLCPSGLVIINQWEYGPDDRLERSIEGGQKVTTYHYDSKGRLSTIIKPDQTKIHHTYDAYGRLHELIGKDLHYTFTYDLNDRLLSDTCFTRKYDPLGNLLEESFVTGQTLKNTYDPQGRRIQCADVTYAYQGPYLSTVSYKGLTHTYLRNLAGKITQHLLPVSGTLTIDYDASLRPVSIYSPHYTAHLAYDSTGNLIRCNEETFTYDGLNQLLSEKENTYTYDSLYNRLSKNETTYTYNTLCQNTEDTYDLNGNLIQLGDIRFGYDALDRLTHVYTNGQTYQYSYDSQNRRLSKKTPTETIHYLWDGQHEIGSSAGEFRVLGEGLGAEIGAAVFIQLPHQLLIPIHDQRGALVVLTTLNGIPLETIRYSAFGEESSDTFLSPWRFCSKRLDPETHFLYFGRRYYAPTLGRWITADPKGFDDGPNLYAYVHNSPLLNIDLYGEWAEYGWASPYYSCGQFLYGAGSYIGSCFYGLGRSALKAGEWMYADFQYEYFNDRSFFLDKSYRAADDWKAMGKAAWNDPLGFVFPGISEAWRNPTSPAAWGKATVDMALIGLSATKISGFSRAGNSLRFGEEFATFSKAESFGDATRYQLSQTVCDGKITGYTYHGLNQAIGRDWGRGVNARAMFDAVNNPKKVIPQANGAVKYVGTEATVIVNSKGKIITTFGKARGPQVWNGSGVVQPPRK